MTKKKPKPKPKDCFIICPIGADQSDARKRADRLLKYVLSPVLKKSGYRPIRADQMTKVGLITSQIINAIMESPMVIADLTGSNPNVFYELAIRHVIGKPYIQLIQTGEKIPFDIGAVRTVHFDIADLESVEKAKTEIELQLKEFRQGHTAESPVSHATAAAILQDHSALAEKIADRIKSMNIGADHSELVQEITEEIRSMDLGGDNYYDGGTIQMRSVRSCGKYLVFGTTDIWILWTWTRSLT